MESRAAKRRRRVSPADGVTPAELREAERGFKLMLAKKFSAAWISANAKDLLGQANVEYAEWREENPPARNPPGWLIVCAYRRALNLLDTETRKPRPAPLDSVFHLADESAPTPEQQALDRERERRLQKALKHLPEKERTLLALVYFKDLSIREAGRKLGWQKSAADRHHKAALDRLHALVGDRELLSPAPLGWVAFVVSKEAEENRFWGAQFFDLPLGVAREGLAISAEGATIGAHRLGDLWRKLSPLAEPGNAAAASGAGRTAGYCGAAAAVLVCGLAASGAVGPGVKSVLPDAARKMPQKTAPVRPTSTQNAEVQTPTLEAPPDFPAREEPTATAERAQPRPQKAHPSRFPKASGKQSASEFGDNTWESGSSSEPAQSSEPPASTQPPPPSAARPSSSVPASEFGY